MELQSLYSSALALLCTELCRCGAGRSQNKLYILLMPLRLIKSRKVGSRQKQGHIKVKRNVFNLVLREASSPSGREGKKETECLYSSCNKTKQMSFIISLTKKK